MSRNVNRVVLPLLTALALAGCAAFAPADDAEGFLTLLVPSDGALVAPGEPFELAVLVDVEADLVESTEVVMTSDLDGELCTATVDDFGIARCEATLFQPGVHIVDIEAFLYEDDPLDAIATRIEVVTDAADLEDADADGYTPAEGDCDDDDPLTYPGALEVVDGRDNDCDGFVDEGIDTVDDDGDGYSDADGDCDDTDPERHPGAVEVLDGIDNDCDRLVDEGTPGYDDDGDGISEHDGDCDDSDPLINPRMPERENGLDDDCDGVVDEGTNAFDDDGDGASENEGDCDDRDPTRGPFAVEIIDGLDNDCDGRIDDETEAFDDDGDGWTERAGDCDDTDPAISPAGVEVTNGRDDNCDGRIDEADGTYVGTAIVWVTGDAVGSCVGDLTVTVDPLGVSGDGGCAAGLVDLLAVDATLVDGVLTGTVSGIAGDDTPFSMPLTGTIAGDLAGGSFEGDLDVDAERWSIFGVFTTSR